ncbi:uncharacterized protein [Amphiura filiformis]|uniref:uncharacterized protein isoform X2 n=1 Tax=Amphiura filiformis TaxID=82378 RepID=UPI003B214451
MQIWMIFNFYKYILLINYLMSGYFYTVDGFVCFVTRMADPNEGGRLRWVLPIYQRWTCTRVFASPVGKHMIYPPAPTDKCCIDGCSDVQMWFEDVLSAFIKQTSTASRTISPTIGSQVAVSNTPLPEQILQNSSQVAVSNTTSNLTASANITSYINPDTNLTASNNNSGQNYLGCFGDGLPTLPIKLFPLALPHSLIVSGDFMSREFCFAHCFSKHMRYAGLQGGWCTCGEDGTDYNIFGQAPDEKCFFRCPGNYEQFCGGSEGSFFGLKLYSSLFELVDMASECNATSIWTYSGAGSCYYEIPTGLFVASYNWADAKQACVDLHTDARMVVINDKQENEFIRGFGYDGYIWLGCSDEPTEGTVEGQWVCIDESGNTFDFNTMTGTGFWVWQDGNPRQDPGLFWSYENCMAMEAGQLKWVDVSCGDAHRVICEVEVTGNCCPV